MDSMMKRCLMRQACAGIVFLALLPLGPAAGEGLVFQPHQLIEDARAQIGVTISYDPAYRRLAFPMGDVDPSTGVCTDVVIRAYRQQGLDLQALVHQDMKKDFDSYPKRWGLKTPDRNIDHRRVPNLQTFFSRHGTTLPVSRLPDAYRPGDIVTWMLPGNLPHIGIVSSRKTARGVPLIIHNIGRGTQEEDILFAYPVTGHYRYPGE